MRIVKSILKWAGIVIGSLLVLGIVVTFIFNRVFDYQIRQNLRTLKAEGRPLTVAEIRPAPIPDDQNAAPLIKKAAEMLGPYIGNQPVPPVDPIFTELDCLIISNRTFDMDITFWPAADREKLPGLIQSPAMQQLFTILAEASKKPGYNNNLKYEDGPSMLLPRLGSIRSMARFLSIKADLAAQSGSIEEAFATVLEGIKLADLLKQEPDLVTQLVRSSCDRKMIDCLERVADKADIPNDKARAIIAELSHHTDAQPWIRSMDVERVRLGFWCYQVLQHGSLKDFIGGTFIEDTFLDKCFGMILEYPLSPFVKKDFVIYLKLQPQHQDYYKVPYYQIAAFIREHPMKKQIPKYSLLMFILPNLDSIVARKAELDAAIEVARVGLGLKLFKQKSGAYPDMLDKLAPEFIENIPVDPCTGKALIYRKDGEGFILYSLGPDQQDDNGTPKPTGKNTTGEEPYDIAWKCGK